MKIIQILGCFLSGSFFKIRTNLQFEISMQQRASPLNFYLENDSPPPFLFETFKYPALKNGGRSGLSSSGEVKANPLAPSSDIVLSSESIERITTVLATKVLEETNTTKFLIREHSSIIRERLSAKMEIECHALSHQIKEMEKKFPPLDTRICTAFEETNKNFTRKSDVLKKSQDEKFSEVIIALQTIKENQQKQAARIERLHEKLFAIQAELTSIWNEVHNTRS